MSPMEAIVVATETSADILGLDSGGVIATG